MLFHVHRNRKPRDGEPRTAAELRSCVKVEVDVLGSLSLIVLTVSVDVKQLGTSVNPRIDLRSCAKVEVAVLCCSVLPYVHRDSADY